MKLLLTSSGLKNKIIRVFFVKTAGNIRGKKIGIVTSAQGLDGQKYIDESFAEVRDLGMIPYEINISTNDSFENLPEIDLWYVCGGNTYEILDRIRKTGLDKILLSEIAKNKYYIGVSAGSIITSRDIIASGWGIDGDEQKGTETNGFGLIDFHILPHYNVVRNEKDVVSLHKHLKKSVVGLTDEQAIYISNSEQKLIGEKGGLINGKIVL